MSVTPFFAASAGGWVMPDGPLMLFLMLAALCFARVLYEPPDGDGHWMVWLAAGLFLGLALLSKYQAFLVLPGAGLLLLAPSHRRWLARPQPYVALALATLVMAPVLVWNMQHGWISFRFQLGRAVGAPGLGWPWIRMVLIESLYLWPWLAAAMLVAAVLAVKRRLRHCGLFLALGLPAILLFNLQPMIGHAGQPHWAMAGWLFFYPLLGEAMATARDGGRRWPIWLAAPSAALFAVLVVALLALPLYFPWLARIKGMDEFARESLAWNGVAAALRAHGLLDRPGTFLAATNWRQAGSLGAAMRGDRPIVPFTSDPRGLAFLDTPARHMGEDAVFAVAPREVAATEAMARRHFASVSKLATVETSYGGVPAFETVILIAHRLEKPYPLPYGLPDP